MIYILCILSSLIIISIITSRYLFLMYISLLLFTVLVIYSFTLIATIVVKLNKLSILINKKSLLTQSLSNEINELIATQNICENIVNNNSSYIYNIGEIIGFIF